MLLQQVRPCQVITVIVAATPGFHFLERDDVRVGGPHGTTDCAAPGHPIINSPIRRRLVHDVMNVVSGHAQTAVRRHPVRRWWRIARG